MRRLLSVVLALGLVLSFSLVTAVPALGDDLYVPSGLYTTITSALAAASDGDTIHVADGHYYENITLKNGVKVMGAGAGSTIIDANDSGLAVDADSVGSTTTIDSFTITNGAGGTGGGIYCAGASLTVSNCIISNSIANYGGGIYNSNSSPVVSNCIITGNYAANSGGGMYNMNNSSPVVVNCIFTGNTAAGYYGGGIYADATSAPTITNCTIVGNTAAKGGGGIYTTGSLSIITNNIIYNNKATTAGTGGGIHAVGPSLSIDYSDVYGNSPNEYYGCTEGSGHIFADPEFVDEMAGDYHLDSSVPSPCIDMGSNGAPSLPATDFEGDPRIYPTGGTVDMGADEYYVPPPPPPPRRTVGGEVYPVDKTALLLPWLSLGLVLILAAGGFILIRRRS